MRDFWSIYFRIHVVEPNWKSIPYGKGLAKQQIWVLDGREQLRRCLPGVAGELYICGKGVAQRLFKSA